ncbi:Smr/MutS family protein [Nannocystaceae bacterium ST9]
MMARKRSGSRGRDDGPSELAAALAPLVDQLAAVAAQREAETRARAELARLRRFDEAGLMALIFEHLDDDNPRVCVGIDFERLVVLDDSVLEPEPEPAPADAAEPEPAEGTESPSLTSVRVARLSEHAWVGRGWVDEVQAIDPAMLDRPELDAEARALLVRARARLLPTLNLRRLEREPALEHLVVFVHACRQQRARFARVITGKGIESRAEPVIKRAVLGWCRDAGLASAPELDVHGEWGSLIVELSLRAD